MIRKLENASSYMDFIRSFADDPVFSDPLLLNEKQIQKNLMEADKDPSKAVLGVFDKDTVTGLFVFYIIEDEKYMELLAGLARVKQAYDELFAYLEKEYSGYDADFIFNPQNYLLADKLKERKAEFLNEQQTMCYTHVPPEVDTDDIVVLSDKYYEQYCAIHDDDGRYWTGEKTARAADRFRVYLAVKDGEAIGYIDVTYQHDENEPIDLFVKEEYRNQGYGRKLLARALKDNEPQDMILQVDVNNRPAIHLYDSLGFIVKKNRNTVTVHWRKIGI